MVSRGFIMDQFSTQLLHPLLESRHLYRLATMKQIWALFPRTRCNDWGVTEIRRPHELRSIVRVSPKDIDRI